jgi:hypothetical protein
MSSIARFVMERSAFAIVPLLGVVAWAFHPTASGPAPVDPWSAPAPSASQQVAAMVDGVARDFGIGTAQAAGGEGQSAAFSYRKARIAESYASHGYRQAETARALGTDVAGLRRMLRQYGIIEWPEGHKGL